MAIIQNRIIQHKTTLEQTQKKKMKRKFKRKTHTKSTTVAVLSVCTLYVESMCDNKKNVYRSNENGISLYDRYIRVLCT